MVRQISVYVDDWHYDELKKSENKSETVREALEQYFKNQKEENNMQELIKKLEGKNIIVGSDWVKENDEMLYEFLLDKLRGYKFEDGNSTTQKDIEEFKKGNWIIEVYFGEGGMNYCAGPDKQAINNQPPWGEDSYEDCEIEELQKYLQQD